MDRASPPTPRAPSRRASALVTGVLALLFALTFGPFSDGQVVGNDALHYAAAVTAGDAEGILLANHLASHPLALAVHRVGAALGPLDGYAGALVAQQLVSALGGALAVVLVWHLLIGLGAPRRTAGLGALALATSSGLWLYASVGETYAAAAAAEAWVLLELWRARGGGWKRLALALAAATLVRQDAVLVAVAVPIVLGLRGLLPLLVGGAASLLVYVVAYASGGFEISVWDWLVGIAATDTWGAGAARPGAGLSAAVHGVLTLDALAFGVHRTDGWSVVRAVALGAIVFHLVALVQGLTRTAVQRTAVRRTANDGHARFALALGVFASVRFAFFAWFQPSNIEYAVGHLTPIVLLLALGWARHARTPRVAVVAVALQAVATLLLVVPLLGRALDADARSLFERGANEGGAALVSIEPFGDLALHRERYRRQDAGDAARFDVIDGSLGADPTRAAEVVAAAGAARDTGRPIIVAIDRRIARHLGLATVEVAPALAHGLVALVDFETLGTSGALLAYLLPAAAAPRDE